MITEKPLIFVSCGQYAQSERDLGRKICKLIEDCRPDVQAYFAQNESTVDGLSRNILGALHEAAGFVCVMHQRGRVFRGSEEVAVRGSVWIEQEIAIVTFMRHALDREIPVLFYVQEDVSMEGIRTVLHLNPLAAFAEESAVIEDLRKRLPGIKFTRYAEYDLQPVISYRADNRGCDRHDYTLIATVKNTGRQTVTDFRLEVHFPRRFLEGSPGNFAAVDSHCCTRTHWCFVADQTRLQGRPLYSGQEMSSNMTIPYHVDDSLEDYLGDKISVKLYSGNMRPLVREYEIREFQEF